MKKILCFLAVLATLNAGNLADLKKAFSSGDYFEAYNIASKECKNDNASACNYLGIMYENGFRVTQDFDNAYKFYSKACELGNAEACANKGFLIHYGKGTDQSYKNAKKYFEKSCKMGYKKGCLAAKAISPKN